MTDIYFTGNRLLKFQFSSKNNIIRKKLEKVEKRRRKWQIYREEGSEHKEKECRD